MGRKAKFSFEVKMDIVKRCLAGKTTANHEAQLLEIHAERVYEWISLYKSLGTEGLVTTSKNAFYSSATKASAVRDYLGGRGSYSDICRKYGIRSSTQLRYWISQYNGHERLKASGTGGCTIMTKGRSTSFDERVEIVQYCIEHNHNYSETAEKFQVSYQQARNYTVKYESNGVEALKDNRGKRKAAEQMTEIERLRAENKILRAEKERAEMEASFLKKLEEIERRRY